MPERDPIPLVRRLLRGDRFAAQAGISLVELARGRAVARMRLRADHLNGVAVAQGGAVFTLADFAFAAASNSHGTVAVALDTSITFVRAATTGVLVAEAREESVSRRVSVCNVRVTDERGEIVALFRGTAFRREETVSAQLALRARRARGARAARPPALEPGRPAPQRRQPGRRR